MSAWKYIMIETDQGQLLPVIFPAELTHRMLADNLIRHNRRHGLDDGEVSEALQYAIREQDLQARTPEWRNGTAVSAGFIGDLQVGYVGGESESIGVKSHPGDADVINYYRLTRGVAEQEAALNGESAADVAAWEGHRHSCRGWRTRNNRSPKPCSCGFTKKE